MATACSLQGHRGAECEHRVDPLQHTLRDEGFRGGLITKMAGGRRRACSRKHHPGAEQTHTPEPFPMHAHIFTHSLITLSTSTKILRGAV